MSLSLPEIPDLAAELEKLLAQIPPGKVATYGTLARALGAPIAARWVGSYLLDHPHSTSCPCHRVVRADGSPGRYIAGTIDDKQKRLACEGVSTADGRVDLARFGMPFEQFRGDSPLARLRAAQESLWPHVSLRGPRRVPELVGGVDVSYASDSLAVAAYVLVDAARAEKIWSTTVRRPAAFPYISSFLAFRELPVLVDLIAAVRRARRLAEIVLVDGSGLLHQRGVGVASHLGVLASIRTVGVTKKLLCGSVDCDQMQPEESRPVVHAERTIGLAIRPTAGSRRPIYVSPGHRIDLATAELVVRRTLSGRRLPEPLYWADRISRAEARSDRDG